jgi:hypothetical protein
MIFIIRNTKDGTKITKKHQIEQQISDSFGGVAKISSRRSPLFAFL